MILIEIISCTLIKIRKLIHLIILISISTNLSGQTVTDSSVINNKPKEQLELTKRTNNLIGFWSLGRKNTYGVWGMFYGRSFNIKPTLIEVRIGCGTKDSFVLGGGVNFRVFNDRKRIELFVATDYSYMTAGTIRYDDEEKYKPYYSDQYKYTECQYLHTYLASRWYAKDMTVALQLKTGYTFLLNPVSVLPSFGPDVNYSKAKNSTESGLMIAIDLILYIKFFEDFRKQKTDK